MTTRLGALLAVLVVAVADGNQGASAAAFSSRASTDLQRLENDIASHEASWRVLFVGVLKRGNRPMTEEETFEPLRRTQRVVDEQRRAVRETTAAATGGTLNVAQQTDRYAEITMRAILARWQLAQVNASMGVDLARQAYEEAADLFRREYAVPAQREAGARRESEARASAMASYRAVLLGLHRARAIASGSAGSLVVQLRQAGRGEKANDVATMAESELDASPADQGGVPTPFDRFLAEQVIGFDPPPGVDPPKPLTMTGAFTPLPAERVGQVPAPKSATFLRTSAIAGYEPTRAIAFGQPVYVRIEFDTEIGPEEREVTLSWIEGGTARTQQLSVSRLSGALFRSDVIEVWPAGPIAVGPAPANANPPAPAQPGGGRGFNPGAGGGAPAADPLATEIAAVRQSIAQKSRDLQTPGPGDVTGPRIARARAGDLRESLDDLRRTFTLSEPPAGSAPATALASFKQLWEPIANEAFMGRPPRDPIAAEQWRAIAGRLQGAPCAGLSAPDGPVRLTGTRWACAADAFFRSLAAFEDQVDRTTAAARTQAFQRADAAMVQVTQTLATGSTVASTDAARNAWRAEMRARLLRAEIEVATVRLASLERRQTAAGADSPYSWFLGIARRTTSYPEWRSAPVVIRATSGSVVKITVGNLSGDATVEARVPDDAPRFFAEKLFHMHDQSRRLASGSAATIERELREYEREFDERFSDLDFESPAQAGLRQQALTEQANTLRANQSAQASKKSERFAIAREHALAALGSSR